MFAGRLFYLYWTVANFPELQFAQEITEETECSFLWEVGFFVEFFQAIKMGA